MNFSIRNSLFKSFSKIFRKFSNLIITISRVAINLFAKRFFVYFLHFDHFTFRRFASQQQSWNFFFEQNYLIWKKLVVVVDAHVEINDYRVNKKRFKKNEKIDLLKKFKFICDRDRNFRIKKIKKRKRDINNIKCDCSFVITTIYYKSKRIWNFNVVNDTHNHENFEKNEFSIVAIYRTKKLTENKMIKIDNVIKQNE